MSRLVIFLFLPIALILFFLIQHLYASLPFEQGDIIVPELHYPVSIYRDKNGVVDIEGKTDWDVFFALGYVHAQDRLWQMVVQRRTTQGRLSEIFGQSSIDNDIWFRTLGLHKSAKEAWDILSPEAQASLQAYTAGVNAWLAADPVLPPEFLVLGFKPEPWQVYDSLAVTKLFALILSANFREEIGRLLASNQLDDVQLATVFKQYPDDAPLTVQEDDNNSDPVNTLSDQTRQGLSTLLELQASIERDLKIGGKFVGSNGWVVAGSHSQTGQALLANDPHLQVQIPSLWYAATLRGEHINSAGMTLVGLPLVILGHNQHIGWGGTNMMADSQDLYFEQIKSDDSSLYLADGQWLPLSVRTETIVVKADFPAAMRGPFKPIEIQVRHTRNGPIISDIYAVFEQPVSLRWTALDRNDTTYEAFFKLNYVTNWQDFKQATGFHISPNMNMLYADRQGNIGYVGVGAIPIRGKGDGTVPVPGWLKEYAWSSFVPPQQWPQVYNPPQGFIVNANNKVVDDQYPYLITQDWASPARATRITAMLEQKIDASNKALTVQDMVDIQADTLSLPASKLLPLLTALNPKNDPQKRAIEYLSNWDGRMSKDSQAASLFTVWMRFLRQRLYADELRSSYGKTAEVNYLYRLSKNVSLDNIYHSLTSPSSQWCDDVSTVLSEDCEQMLLASLEDAIGQLQKLKGDDMSSWQWGHVNSSYYSHLPMSNFKLLDVIFERKVGNGGSPYTVNVSGSFFQQAEGYLQNFGAGFRQIYAMGSEKITHLYMNSTGQSGNVISANYDDMVLPFNNVEFALMQAPTDKSKKLSLLPKNRKDGAGE